MFEFALYQQWFDFHTHIQNIPSNVEIIDKSVQNGCQGMMVCATNSLDWNDVLHLKDGNNCIIGSIGVHPWWANRSVQDFEDDMKKLEDILKRDISLCVGEIGLDMCPKGLSSAPFDIQEMYFKRQMEIALELNRPVSVHIVRCFQQFAVNLSDVSSKLREKNKVHGNSYEKHRYLRGLLLHSWGGGTSSAAQILKISSSMISTAPPSGSKYDEDNPVLFSFHGPIVLALNYEYEKRRTNCNSLSEDSITNKSFSNLRSGSNADNIKTLCRLPHHHLAFETDSPDQSFMKNLTPSYIEWMHLFFPEHAKSYDICLNAPHVASTNSPLCIQPIIHAAAVLRVANNSTSDGIPMVGGRAKSIPPPYPFAHEVIGIKMDSPTFPQVRLAVRSEYQSLILATERNFQKLFRLSL